jgi:hypothetical protein
MKTKKTYIVPAIAEEAVLTEQFLADSGVSSDNGIGYGGVDTEGEKDPSSRRDAWDDLEEEEF